MNDQKHPSKKAITIDKNIVNVLGQQIVTDLLPLLGRSEITIHLCDTLFQELILDESVNRRAGHADALRKIFNGKIIYTLPDLVKAAIEKSGSVFYGDEIQARFQKLLDDLASKKPLSSTWSSKRNSLLAEKVSYDNDLKMGQEDNLRSGRIRKRSAVTAGGLTQAEWENFSFEDYFEACLDEWKVGKLQQLLTINKIPHDSNMSSYLNDSEFPLINHWLRTWFAYHHYTSKRGQSTLRQNDASDLGYLMSAYCVDHLVTNDVALIGIGNTAFNNKGKCMNWVDFRLRFIDI